jgi:hypothetical protein
MIQTTYFKWSLGIVAGIALTSQLLPACSAGTGLDKNSAKQFGAAGGTPTALGSGGAAGTATGPNPIVSSGGDGTVFMPIPGLGTSGTQGVAPDAGCPALRQKPEQVTTYKPVALFIMQDRTGSMVSGFPSGCACSWGNSTAALTAFVNDPDSAGLDVGLSFFGGTDKTVCDGSDCGMAVVPIEPIAMAGPPITSAMNSNAPNPANITPLECGLRGMIDACLVYSSQSPIGERCVAVLVTDGNTTDPTPCDANVADLVQIVADGQSKGVNTYTLGLQGSDPNFLDQIAQAGGTMAHIDASGGVQAFVSALNSIRKMVSISTPLPCTWKVPAVPQGSTFEPNKVNVQFVPPGAAPRVFGHVNSQADCANAMGDAWYYDNATDPSKATEVIACQSACDGTLHSSGTGEVDVLFGCDTIPAMIR